MAENGKYLIGESLREKLKSTIARVDALAPGGPEENIPTVHQGMPAFVPKTFRVCTFTGSWAINATKTVTFKGVTTTPNTVSVTNVFCGLSPTGSCDVTVAKDGTAWYLVAPNLTQQPGYSSSGTQVLSVVDGSLKWTQPQTTSVLTSVSLDSSGLKFITTSINIFGTVSSSVTTIGTTACA
jgi:hypothetical protein